MKKYIAKSHVAVCVTYADGSHKHISFSPKTNGGSVYYSDDETEQSALESHPRFGKLFRIDTTPAPVVEQPVETKEETAVRDEEGHSLTVITVSDLAAAKDYLCDKFGLSRTKLRSSAAILAAAKENGIQFAGI